MWVFGGGGRDGQCVRWKIRSVSSPLGAVGTRPRRRGGNPVDARPGEKTTKTCMGLVVHRAPGCVSTGWRAQPPWVSGKSVGRKGEEVNSETLSSRGGPGLGGLPLQQGPRPGARPGSSNPTTCPCGRVWGGGRGHCTHRGRLDPRFVFLNRSLFGNVRGVAGLDPSQVETFRAMHAQQHCLCLLVYFGSFCFPPSVYSPSLKSTRPDQRYNGIDPPNPFYHQGTGHHTTKKGASELALDKTHHTPHTTTLTDTHTHPYHIHTHTSDVFTSWAPFAPPRLQSWPGSWPGPPGSGPARGQWRRGA